MTRACLESIYRFSGRARGRVIAICDGTSEHTILTMLDDFRDHHPDLVVLRDHKKLGFVHSCNLGFALRQRDMMLLRSDSQVTPGWLEEMLELLYSSDRIASVSPLCLDRILDLRSSSIPRTTDIPVGVGSCLYRHWVLNTIGDFDSTFGQSDDVQIDWAMRARGIGLRHVRANRAVVFGPSSIEHGHDSSANRNRQLLSRHPQYLQQVQSAFSGAEGRAARHFVTSKLRPLTVGLIWQSLSAMHDAAEGLVRELNKQPGIEAVVCDQHSLENVQVLYCPAPMADFTDLFRLLESPCHLVLGIDNIASPRLNLARWAVFFSACQCAQAVVANTEEERAELISELCVDPALVEVVSPLLPVSPEQLKEVAARLASIFRRTVDRPSESTLRHRTLLANFVAKAIPAAHSSPGIMK